MVVLTLQGPMLASWGNYCPTNRALSLKGQKLCTWETTQLWNPCGRVKSWRTGRICWGWFYRKLGLSKYACSSHLFKDCIFIIVPTKSTTYILIHNSYSKYIYTSIIFLFLTSELNNCYYNIIVTYLEVCFIRSSLRTRIIKMLSCSAIVLKLVLQIIDWVVKSCVVYDYVRCDFFGLSVI